MIYGALFKKNCSNCLILLLPLIRDIEPHDRLSFGAGGHFVNPAFVEADANTVQATTSGILSFLGSMDRLLQSSRPVF
jgi:hypothetical protein